MILSTLVNDLADVDDEIYLTLEDYHWITNPEVHEALSFFLKHAPSNCHVVLTTRTEPPLPPATLRAQNKLLEIDASALRFDLQEMRHFIEVERPDLTQLLRREALAREDGRLAGCNEDNDVHVDSIGPGFRAIRAQPFQCTAADRRLFRRNARWPAARHGSQNLLTAVNGLEPDGFRSMLSKPIRLYTCELKGRFRANKTCPLFGMGAGERTGSFRSGAVGGTTGGFAPTPDVYQPHFIPR